MKKKSVIYLPAGSVLFGQIWLLLISVEAIIPCILYLEGEIKAILVISLIFLWFLQIIIIVFSVLFWWNVPLKFTPEGIYRKKKIYLWKNAVDIQTILKFPTDKGHLYVKTKIIFNDDSTICFTPDSFIKKSILKVCEDEIFLNRYQAYIKNDDFMRF